MAKLDDFGRPIYETAEEYNKAHKGGVCPRTYDSPKVASYHLHIHLHSIDNSHRFHYLPKFPNCKGEGY